MKRFPMFVLTSLIFSSSCKSLTYFETPNAIRNIPATLYLVNGRSYHGKLIIHTNSHSHSAVKLYTDGDKKPMRFSINEVTAYETRNDYYELKEVRGGLRFSKEYSFMKRLTKENSRIHLFENVRKVSNHLVNILMPTQHMKRNIIYNYLAVRVKVCGH